MSALWQQDMRIFPGISLALSVQKVVKLSILVIDGINLKWYNIIV